MELVIESLAQADTEDLEVGMGLEHGYTIAVDLAHCIEQHTAFTATFLAYDEMVCKDQRQFRLFEVKLGRIAMLESQPSLDRKGLEQ